MSICVSDGALLYTNLGHNVTLPCFSSSAKHLSWYKQVAGEPPQLISSFYQPSHSSNIFYDHFKNNNRFSVDTGTGFYHLNISNVQVSDSATYYCGQTTVSLTKFYNAIFLVLRGIFFCFCFSSQLKNDFNHIFFFPFDFQFHNPFSNVCLSVFQSLIARLCSSSRRLTLWSQEAL